MPNPIGRKRSSPVNAEVEALKKVLQDLKSMYFQDISNISADIQTLGQQTQITETPSEAPSGTPSES